MDRRKIINEAEARRALGTIARRGLTIGEWAQAHGVDGRSLHAWDMTLTRKEKRRVSGRRAGLVELVPAIPAAKPARYQLRVGDLAVEFGDDAQEETLRRVIRALQSC